MRCKIFFFLGLLLIFICLPNSVFSVSTSGCPSEDFCNSKSGQDKIDCYRDLVDINCKKEISTLSEQVNYFNGQIRLNELNIEKTSTRIDQLQDEIATLSGKIDRLESSLSTVINVLIERIVATYKSGSGEFIYLLLSSNGFSDFLTRAKYIRIVQEHDKKLLFQMQETKNSYVDQKAEREKKKKEQADLKVSLTQQEINLASNKKQKEVLLETTKNNNTKYQQLLTEAIREQQDIQRAASIISTNGEKKSVHRGDPIGLMGNTGFSTGAHLHLSVYNLKEQDLSSFNFNSGYENPFSYLSSQNTHFESTSCDDVSSDQNKNIGGGNWAWPMSSVTISQCYGHTPWSWRYSIGIHNGVDMYNNDDIVVRAVDDGDAFFYRGGQANGNGVFIFHGNGKMSLYWHLQ